MPVRRGHFKAVRVTLPEGVTEWEWGEEKVRRQNPRIRAFLGCLRLLDSIHESNFAVLHCSPARLLEIWSAVRQVARSVEGEIAPLLKDGSVIPSLAAALEGIDVRFEILRRDVLLEMEAFPPEPQVVHYERLRRLLCVVTGHLHSFLLDTLGEILAADPRSQHDADYFISVGFRRDLDDAEWLCESLGNLSAYLELLNSERWRLLSDVADAIESGHGMPTTRDWSATADYLDRLSRDLVPLLRKIIGPRSIRLEELQVMEGYSHEIPTGCAVATVLFETLREVSIGDLAAGELEGEVREALERVIGEQLARALRNVDGHLRDLVTFIPLWQRNVAMRRALLFRSTDDSGPMREQKAAALQDSE
jgi:hypothetical protein